MRAIDPTITQDQIIQIYNKHSEKYQEKKNNKGMIMKGESKFEIPDHSAM